MNATHSSLPPLLYATDVASYIGLFFNGLIVATSASPRYLRQISVHQVLCINLCFSDLILNVTGCFLHMVVFIYGPSVLSIKALCVAEGFMNTLGAGASIIAVVSLTLSRYQFIVLERNMSRKMAWTIIIVAFCSIIASNSLNILITSGKVYIIQTSGLYCNVNWASNNLETQVFNGIAIVLILGPVVFLAFAYTSIYLKMAKTTTELRNALNSEDTGKIQATSPNTDPATNLNTSLQDLKKMPISSPPQQIRQQTKPAKISKHEDTSAAGSSGMNTEKFLREQNSLLVQSVLIVANFVFGWALFLASIVYSFLTHENLSPSLDRLAMLLLVSSTSLDPIIILYFNKGIQERVLHFFRFK